GSETISLLQADEELHSGTTLTLPDPDTLNFVEAGKVDGTYMLMMQVDAAGTVDEMMEENNIFFMPIRLEMPRGMMEVTDSLNDPYDLMIDIGPVLEGDSVNESFTVTNAGAGVININGIATDNDMFTITQNGTNVDGASVFAVDPQANLTFEVVFNAAVQGYHQGQIQIISDDPDGADVFLSVWADVVSTPVDLSLDSITTAFSAHWGDTTDITLGIRNLQDNEAEDVFVEVILSDSQDPFSAEAMSFPLGNESIGAVTGNANIHHTLSITLPEVSPFGFGGQFYLHTVISPTGSSFDENIENNENVASLEITTEAVGKPDLAFAWLWLPPEAQWGDTVDVSAGIRNMGMADAGSFDVHYYLSDNDELDSNDQLINEGADTGLPGLSAMGEIEGQLTLTLPEDGTVDMYYLIVVIDPANTVLEDFEDNNMAIGRFLMDSGQTIDLEAVSVSAPQEVTIGDMFDITLNVSNTGPEDAMDVRVEFFLSEQGQTDEFFLGQFIGSTPIDVNAGQTTTAIYQTMLPDGLVDPGQDYLIRAFVDANQMYFESDEGNNIILSLEPIHAVGGDIDLTAAFDYVPAQGSWDESFAIDVTISNTGDITAAPFFVDAFLSSDDTLDTSDFYLASKMVYALDGSTEQTLNMDIFLPHSRPGGDGDYHLLVNVDGGQCVVENDEGNNVIGSIITISGTPDLAIFWEETPYNTNFGQTITVTDEVENRGNSPAGGFEISYYLSDDMVFGEDDVLLGSRTVASLAAESENTADTDLSLPEEGDEGQYYLIAVADATNEID
ncbi:MAG: hypothetical protein KAJ52_10420, partial [Sedimentisphaerales bacterium]|nr:hypothetical protein [Sedimentisphaerales bacterium]